MAGPSPFVLFRSWVLRDILEQRFIALASVVAILLGVAVFCAIRLANRSALESIDAAQNLLTGQSDLEITQADGKLPERLWQQLGEIKLIEHATPVVELTATLRVEGEQLAETAQTQLVRVTGLDPFTSAPFQSGSTSAQEAPLQLTASSLGQWLSSPLHIWLDERLAAKLQLKVGSALTLSSGTRELRAIVGGLLPAGNNFTPEKRVWMDIGWAQYLSAQAGTLSAIYITEKDSTKRDSLIASLRALPAFPAQASVRPGEQNSEQLRELFSAYQLNLSALSLVSLLVGIFLIYGTLAAMISRRSRELAVLRSLGMRRESLFVLILSYAACFALVGIALGLPLGVLSSRLLLESIQRGLLNESIAQAVSNPQLPATELLWCALVGLAAALLGAALPAFAALRQAAIVHLHPHRALKSRHQADKTTRVLAASLLVACAIFALLSLLTPLPWLAFFSCLCLLLATVLLLPSATKHATRLLTKLLPLSPFIELAVRNVARSIARHQLTMAGLVIALSMVAGLEIMIFSFRHSLNAWMENSLQASYYLSQMESKRSAPVPIDASFRDEVLQIEGIDATQTLKQSLIELADGSRYPLNVLGSEQRSYHFQFARSTPQSMEDYESKNAVFITQALAKKTGLSVGEDLLVKAPSGTRSLPIAAIIIDYSDQLGTVYMDHSSYSLLSDDLSYNALSVYTESGLPLSAAADRALRRLADKYQLEISNQGELRAAANEVFDATFHITYALRTIAVFVAIVATMTMVNIELRERASEVANMRAQGASRKQIFHLHLYEGSILGAMTGVFGTLCGLVLALLLSFVVIRAFFSWTMGFHAPWPFVLLLPVAMIACVLAAVALPSLRSSETSMIAALREE